MTFILFPQKPWLAHDFVFFSRLICNRWNSFWRLAAIFSNTNKQTISNRDARRQMSEYIWNINPCSNFVTYNAIFELNWTLSERIYNWRKEERGMTEKWKEKPRHIPSIYPCMYKEWDRGNGFAVLLDYQYNHINEFTRFKSVFSARIRLCYWTYDIISSIYCTG